jgi:hypothetical protein
MRQTVPSARPADLRYWSGVEEQVQAVLSPPVEAKQYPAKKKKADRGIGSIVNSEQS